MRDITCALLATQRALLGVVTPALRAVVVDVDEKENIFKISFFYDHEVDEDTLELWSIAATEASCDLPFKYNRTEEKYKRIDYPEKIPITSESYAYHRYEKKEWEK